MWTTIEKVVLFGMLVLILGMLCGQVVYGNEWSNEDIVNSIYKAEGGDRAEYPYGIRSIQCDTPDECRRICFNTVRNQRRRHKAHICNYDFLSCLAERYAPTKGADNDPKGLNIFWLKNVTWFLEHPDRR